MNGAVGERPAFDDEAQPQPAFERQIGSGGRGLHARDGVDALERLAAMVSMAAVWSKWLPVSAVSMVSTLCGSKPGATLCSAENVRISRPAPISSTIASAISAITSTPRTLFCRRPEPAREPLSFSVELRSAREACSAGHQAEEDAREEREQQGEAEHASNRA